MRISEASSSYIAYPLTSRVSVGDRPVTATAQAPAQREVSEEDLLQIYPIPTYGRKRESSTQVEDARSSTNVPERFVQRLSLYA